MQVPFFVNLSPAVDVLIRGTSRAQSFDDNFPSPWELGTRQTLFALQCQRLLS